MKKLISTILALTLICTAAATATLSASAAETKEGMLYSAEDQIGNGYNDFWGMGGGLDNGKWANGTNKFTEGTSSVTLVNSFANRLSFFHNFTWPGSLIDDDWTNGQGVDLTQYDYIEFDLASEYEMDCTFAMCMCGQVGAWHGSDAYRGEVHFEPQTWYHVAMPVSEFVHVTCPADGDPRAYVGHETSMTACQRFRLEITAATDETGGIPEEIYLYFDNMYGTKGDAPQAKDTMKWGPDCKFAEDGTTLNFYQGEDNVSLVIPSQTVAIADNTFAGFTFPKVTIPAGVTSIGTGNFENMTGLIIAGEPGSYAETYATEHGFTFQDTTNLLGDVNGDTKVNATDALMVLQAAVSKITLDEKQTVRADVNKDENIDATDALLILQFAVNKIPEF